ncbi:MAG: hypothetical protein ACTTKL_08615 [Treponema sp.]
MAEILYERGGAVFLDTGLDEAAFAKTKFSRHGDKAGFVVSKDDEGEYSVFSEWKFDGVQTIDGAVFFCGKFAAAQPLTGRIRGKIPYAVCQAYTHALKQGIALPLSAPQGILAADNALLFVPEDAFDRSAANHGRDFYTRVQDAWRDSALRGEAAICFTRAVWAYYAVSGALPYPPDLSAEKIVSLAHKNFLPLEYCALDVSAVLAKSVNAALKGARSVPPFPLEDLKTQFFPPEDRIVESAEEQRIAEEKLRLAAERYRKRQERKIKRMRLFNRKFAAAAAVALTAAFIAFFSATVVSERGKKPCVVGLTSAQTVEVFYKGIHTMDTDFILATAKNCPEAQRYVSLIPQIYALSQMRGAYNFQSGISTPENWFFFEPDSSRAYSRTVYGITGFNLDGTPSTLNLPVPSRKHHPPRLRFEDGERIKNGSEKLHSARFYLVHTVDDALHIEKHDSEITLVMKNDRWQIKKLRQTVETEIISPAAVSIDFKRALEECRGDEIQAADMLRGCYPWLPSCQSLIEEKARLDAIGY